MGHRANDAFDKFRYSFNTFVAERLKLLLETKHLYQRLSIAPEDICAKLREGIANVADERDSFDRLVEAFISVKFAIADKPLFHQPGNIPIPCLAVGNVKLCCSKCGTREAFRPIWFSEITNELLEQSKQAKFRISFGRTFQLFYIVYQCQRCEDKPEVFLLRRDGLDLCVEGRSPIEHLEIPKYIPKEERNWFRDAMIGFQTGKILAALFYLRTFIEQFARRKTNFKEERKTGDEIMAAYTATLPPNLRDTMPSLGEWYDKLSEALHGAKEDAELFEAARERIEKHFDIRRVHDLDKRA
jgi:hypothetical protein